MPNDYTNAINAYDKTNKSALQDPREIEARALSKAADRFQMIKDDWENQKKDPLDQALTSNQQLWAIFVGEMEKEDTGIPVEIRSNIANLGIYTFKRTIEIRAEPAPEKLDILININRNIASGLLESIKTSKEQTTKTPTPESTSSSTPTTGNNPYADTQTSQPPNNPTDIDI